MLAKVVLRRPAGGVVARNYLFLSFYHQDVALNDYTEKPKYPPILDMSPEAKRIRRKEKWHEKVTTLPTVEQKMVELNMPRYYGHWSCHLIDNRPTLLTADFCQYATRTHLQKGLPQEYYSDVWEEAEAVAGKVAGQVEQLIDFNFNTPLNRNRTTKFATTLTRRATWNFLSGLHRLLSGALQDTPHIREATVDLLPRVEAYWILGGVPPDNMMKKTRKGVAWTKHTENDPMERPMQGMSQPAIGVRVEEGLPEVVERGHALATEGKVPPVLVDPRALGLRFKHKHATTVTACWPSEGKQHGQLFLHTRDYQDVFKQLYGAHNLPTAHTHKAVLASFTQAHAHATYLGFGPVTELTYPLVQQSGFTDGRTWSLGLYQLNTCCLHSQPGLTSPLNNILWLSEEEELFSEVGEGGVKGLNTPLLTSLLAMYLKKGVARPDPTPYLPLKHVANHPASEEYRKAFHDNYLHLCSGRPRARDKPELYLWEKIYKVDFQTRPFDAPQRFFEKHFKQKDPGQRRLDDYNGPYIPKSLRTDKKVKRKPILNSEHLYKYD